MLSHAYFLPVINALHQNPKDRPRCHWISLVVSLPSAATLNNLLFMNFTITYFFNWALEDGGPAEPSLLGCTLKILLTAFRHLGI